MPGRLGLGQEAVPLDNGLVALAYVGFGTAARITNRGNQGAMP